MRICRRPASRSQTTRCSRNASVESTRTSGRGGSTSVHRARDGSATGALTSRKLGAPSLVVMKNRSSWWLTEYSMPARRASIVRNESSGRSALTNRTSEVEWLPSSRRRYAWLRVR